MFKVIFKLLLWLVGIVLVLVAGVALWVGFVVDPNDYKDQIAALVKEQTGRDLTIGGSIDLSFYPFLGLKLGQVRLSNAPGFGELPFVAVEHADVAIALLPLLEQRMQAEKVVLRGMELNLARDESGKTNWDDLLVAPAAQPAAQAGAAPQADDADSVMAVTVGGVEFSGARVVWTDATAGHKAVVRDLSLHTGELAPGKPFDLKLAFGLDNEQPALAGDFTLGGRWQLAPDLQTLAVENLAFTAKVRGPGEFAEQTELTLSAGLRAALPAQTLTLDGLKLSLTTTLPEQGEVRRAWLDLGGDVVANGETQQVTVAGLKLDVKVEGRPDVLKEATTALAGELALDGAQQSLRLDGLTLKSSFALPAQTHDLAGTVDHVDVVFSEVMDAASFRAEDVAITAPGGSIVPTSVTKLTDSRFRVNFPAQTAS